MGGGAPPPLQLAGRHAQCESSAQKQPVWQSALTMYWHIVELGMPHMVPLVGLVAGQPGTHGDGPFSCQPVDEQ